MTINSYFQLNGGTEQANEAKLVQDMSTELIQISGVDMYYLPRTISSTDQLFGEDILSSFDTKYRIEMYIDNYEGYQSEDVLAQFGIDVSDQIELTVSAPRFKTETGMDKPIEGDLIYWSVSNSLFEIKFVEDELQNFYTHGNLYTWKIRCQLFDFSHETITTLADIDSDLTALDEINISLEANSVDLINDPLADEPTLADGINSNEEIETEGGEVISFSESSPFGSY